MAQISRQGGTTSHVLNLVIYDTSGVAVTGLAYNTSGLTCYYKRNRGTTSVAVTLASITTLGTYVSGGFKEIDATNMPGHYEFHPPDAALASGSGTVAFNLKGGGTMAPCVLLIELTATSNQDAVAGGMSALPNAAANANGGLPILSSGGTTLAYTISTLTTYTGNTVQTGDAFARIGAGGAGLTALGDARLANLDAAVSTRLATAGYTAPDTTKTGYKLAADGLDAVVVESGLNMRQAQAVVAAMAAGVLAGAATTSVTIAAAGVPSTNRITATVDSSGNRTAVTVNPPA